MVYNNSTDRMREVWSKIVIPHILDSIFVLAHSSFSLLTVSLLIKISPSKSQIIVVNCPVDVQVLFILFAVGVKGCFHTKLCLLLSDSWLSPTVFAQFRNEFRSSTNVSKSFGRFSNYYLCSNVSQPMENPVSTEFSKV